MAHRLEALSTRLPLAHRGEQAWVRELVEKYENGGFLRAGELLSISHHLRPPEVYPRTSLYMPQSFGSRLHLGQAGHILAEGVRYVIYGAATIEFLSAIVREGF